MNRGRLQAQGGTTEKSSPWATPDDITKVIGINHLNDLTGQLTQNELSERVNAINKVRNIITNAPTYGLSPMKKSYPNSIHNREVRIDIEIHKGVAFIND
jgi:hypothetical protein